MNLEELEARVKTLEDIEEIKKLQRSYGYYLEHGMVEEIIDLFADDPDGGFWHAGIGMYRGKEGVRNFFEGYCRSSQSTEFIAQLMQLSGIVDVDPDGKTAKGRWYGLGPFALPHPKGVTHENRCVIYENDYIKENAKWKIKIFRIYHVYDYRPRESFVKPERLLAPEPQADIDVPSSKPSIPKPDIYDHTNVSYPSGYIVPFHFKHPVTEKETSEGVRNSLLNKKE